MASMTSVLGNSRSFRYHYMMLIGQDNEFKAFGGNAIEMNRVRQLGKAPIIEAINALGDFGYRVAFSTPKHNSDDVTYLLEKSHG